MEQKAFYEIEQPAKTAYAVVVFAIKNDTGCTHAEPFYNKAGDKIGQLACDSGYNGEEIYECGCCGMPTCDDHLSKNLLHGAYVCKVCAKLPIGLMESIYALRLELNQP